MTMCFTSHLPLFLNDDKNVANIAHKIGEPKYSVCSFFIEFFFVNQNRAFMFSSIPFITV